MYDPFSFDRLGCCSMSASPTVLQRLGSRRIYDHDGCGGIGESFSFCFVTPLNSHWAKTFGCERQPIEIGVTESDSHVNSVVLSLIQPVSSKSWYKHEFADMLALLHVGVRFLHIVDLEKTAGRLAKLTALKTV